MTIKAKKNFKIIPKITDSQYYKYKKNNFFLETISLQHIEMLRKWKNKHRQYFFLKEIISKESQFNWFKDYQKRIDDFIFVVNYNGLKIGCIGFRIIDDVVDIYNVILANKKFSKKGIMSFCLSLLCSYLFDYYFTKFKYSITVRVLIDNSARSWYEKNHFIEIKEKEDHVLMKLDISKLKYIDYEIIEFKI